MGSDVTVTEAVQPARPAGASEAVDRDALYNRIAWRLIPVLGLCYLMAAIDRSNIGFAKLDLSHALGFNDAIIGMGVGIFTVGSLLIEIPSNVMLGRIGVRWTFAIIMIAWGVISAAFALMTLPWHFYSLRFLLGVAEGGFFPGVIYYLSWWAPRARRARLMALFMMSFPLSGFIGGPLSGMIMQGMEGAYQLHGWQWLFILEGIPSCLIGVLAWFMLKNTPAAASWLTPAQKAAVAADLEAEYSVARDGPAPSAISVLATSKFLALAIVSFALLAATSGASLWLPSILRNAGMDSVLLIGFYSSAPYVFGLAAQYLVARGSDRSGERRWHIAISLLVSALGWLLTAIFHADPLIALVAMTLAIAGAFASLGPFWAMSPEVFRGRSAAVGVAALAIAGGLGNLVSPLVVGYLSVSTGSLALAQLYFAAVMAVSAVVMVAMVSKRSLASPTNQP